MPSAIELLKKAKRRLWMKYAMRGVSGNDNHPKLELAYAMSDPWNMASTLERARFEATNALIERTFGPLGSVLELGCGEGHQTEYLARVSTEQFGVDVSARAVERARTRLPGARFEVADIFSQPWGDTRHRFDLVTACEVLYYISDPAKTLAQMRHLGRNGLVTFFAPAVGRTAPPLEQIPGLQRDWIYHDRTAWLVAWWRND